MKPLALVRRIFRDSIRMYFAPLVWAVKGIQWGTAPKSLTRKTRAAQIYLATCNVRRHGCVLVQ